MEQAAAAAVGAAQTAVQLMPGLASTPAGSPVNTLLCLATGVLQRVNDLTRCREDFQKLAQYLEKVCQFVQDAEDKLTASTPVCVSFLEDVTEALRQAEALVEDCAHFGHVETFLRSDHILRRLKNITFKLKTQLELLQADINLTALHLTEQQVSRLQHMSSEMAKNHYDVCTALTQQRAEFSRKLDHFQARNEELVKMVLESMDAKEAEAKSEESWREVLLAEIQQLRQEKGQHKRAKEEEEEKTMQGILHLLNIIDKTADWFKCPLSGRIMQDPVFLTSMGYTFERHCIEDYLRQHQAPPIIGQVPLMSNVHQLVPNQQLRQQIWEWRNKARQSTLHQEDDVITPLPVPSNTHQYPAYERDTTTTTHQHPFHGTGGCAVSLWHPTQGGTSDLQSHPTPAQRHWPDSCLSQQREKHPMPSGPKPGSSMLGAPVPAYSWAHHQSGLGRDAPAMASGPALLPAKSWAHPTVSGDREACSRHSPVIPSASSWSMPCPQNLGPLADCPCGPPPPGYPEKRTPTSASPPMLSRELSPVPSCVRFPMLSAPPTPSNLPPCLPHPSHTQGLLGQESFQPNSQLSVASVDGSHDRLPPCASASPHDAPPQTGARLFDDRPQTSPLLFDDTPLPRSRSHAHYQGSIPAQGSISAQGSIPAQTQEVLTHGSQLQPTTAQSFGLSSISSSPPKVAGQPSQVLLHGTAPPSVPATNTPDWSLVSPPEQSFTPLRPEPSFSDLLPEQLLPPAVQAQRHPVPQCLPVTAMACPRHMPAALSAPSRSYTSRNNLSQQLASTSAGRGLLMADHTAQQMQRQSLGERLGGTLGDRMGNWEESEAVPGEPKAVQAVMLREISEGSRSQHTEQPGEGQSSLDSLGVLDRQNCAQQTLGETRASLELGAPEVHMQASPPCAVLDTTAPSLRASTAVAVSAPVSPLPCCPPVGVLASWLQSSSTTDQERALRCCMTLLTTEIAADQGVEHLQQLCQLQSLIIRRMDSSHPSICLLAMELVAGMAGRLDEAALFNMCQSTALLEMLVQGLEQPKQSRSQPYTSILHHLFAHPQLLPLLICPSSELPSALATFVQYFAYNPLSKAMLEDLHSMLQLLGSYSSHWPLVSALLKELWLEVLIHLLLQLVEHVDVYRRGGEGEELPAAAATALLQLLTMWVRLYSERLAEAMAAYLCKIPDSLRTHPNEGLRAAACAFHLEFFKCQFDIASSTSLAGLSHGNLAADEHETSERVV